MSDTQTLHLVFGGELESPAGLTFRDVKALDLVGIYDNCDEAYAAWQSKAQATVDNAHMRYFLLDLNSLMQETAAA